ncbi:MAG: NRDE family protein [Flavobacteriaceae bacterium]|nr:NRDE family protein [Flavobacteriaceae bacterium]
MCTVTFLALENNGFILTSSRDERHNRKTTPPKTYLENGVKLTYPKDELAGGTWIGLSDKKRLVCVLNGALTKHIRKKSYLKSRGVLAKEILKMDVLNDEINSLNLEGMEPFTMVIIDWNKGLNLQELIWDETHKTYTKLPIASTIWSSATLYSENIKKQRVDWFKNWTDNTTNIQDSILAFHHSEIGSKENSLVMKRSTVETVSITSIQKNAEGISIIYNDLLTRKTNKSIIHL